MESAQELFEHELQSVYDGTKRLLRALEQIAKRASHPELTTKIRELRTASEEQARRLEDIFHLMGRRPQRSESRAIQGLLHEFTDTVKEQKPEKEPLDLLACQASSDIAQYLMHSYETLLLLAERSGAAHSAPRVSGHLKVSLREEKKLGKDIQGLAEPLIEQLRPA